MSQVGQASLPFPGLFSGRHQPVICSPLAQLDLPALSKASSFGPRQSRATDRATSGSACLAAAKSVGKEKWNEPSPLKGNHHLGGLGVIPFLIPCRFRTSKLSSLFTPFLPYSKHNGWHECGTLLVEPGLLPVNHSLAAAYCMCLFNRVPYIVQHHHTKGTLSLSLTTKGDVRSNQKGTRLKVSQTKAAIQILP